MEEDNKNNFKKVGQLLYDNVTMITKVIRHRTLSNVRETNTWRRPTGV